QRYAKMLVDERYQTIIYGDHDHPEVKGIYGATDKQSFIISNLDELKSVKLNSKVGFVAQTTKSPESYKKIISSVIKKVKELKVFNTICNTTEIRQSSARRLAIQVDVMFVIGGHNSANTNRLAEICKQTGTPTYHIETVREINWQWIEGKEKIGITAGASTPDWLIKEVIEVMSEEKKDVKLEENIIEQVEEVNEETNEEIKTETNEEVTEDPGTENDEDIKEETVEESNVEIQKEVSEDNEETEETAEETVAEEDIEETEEESIESDEDTADSEEAEEEFRYSDNEIADLKKGQTIKGTVVEVNKNGVYVDVGYKTEGFIPLRELTHKDISDANEIANENDEIDVVILTLEDDEGNMILSKKRADYEKAWERIMEVYENNKVIEAKVTKEVKGGLVVDVGLRGFIPASHVAIGYVEDLKDYVGETLRLKVIEVERDNNNVVLSAKAVQEEEREQFKKDTLESLEEGQAVTGTITKLVNFGAFVDIGGIEGLLHISEMSWGRIGHPSEVLEEGQNIEVKVLGIDRENERISLGYKQLIPDPWEEFAEKHYEGEIVTGTITKLVDFGAFMEIEKGIEGLIHISQLSRRHVQTPDEVVEVGEEIQAKIINIDPDRKRVGLSIKELEDKPEPKQEKKPKPKKEEEDTGSGITIGDLVGDIFDNEEE
ncbi:MAG: bifunctional 4-hydroxy-3-methylbut-2-enyl diphosphate reductase/30S ribosomal protein S1, partial [Bacillota bacterium]